MDDKVPSIVRPLNRAGKQCPAEPVEHRAGWVQGSKAGAVTLHKQVAHLLGQTLEVGDERGAGGPVGEGVGAVKEVGVHFLEDGDLLAAVRVQHLGVLVNREDGVGARPPAQGLAKWLFACQLPYQSVGDVPVVGGHLHRQLSAGAQH